MGAVLDKYFWENNNITNRVLQCDYISEKTLKVLRIIGLALMTEIVILSYCNTEYFNRRNHLFFTVWGAYLCWILYIFIFVCYFYPNNGFLWKTTHMLFVLVISYGVCITIVFWAVLIPIVISSYKITAIDVVSNVEAHGLNYIWVALDFYYNRIEFAWNQYSVVILYGAIYMIYNAIYTLVANDEIYDGVDWKGWFTAAFVLAAAVCVSLAFALFRKLSEYKKPRYCKIGIEATLPNRNTDAITIQNQVGAV